MLTKIELNNFRKHRALNLDFTSGLNTIRAQNEGGKSTLIEAVSYALFGSRALRTPIEDTVTWGEDTRTLKVSLDVTHSGKNYKFTRSKAGAEVVFDGEVFVTGQNEVSNFASGIIGADLNLTNKLMFSGQNSIRAAIEEGPKALSQLIENLAGMDVFDTILENAQNSLAMGSTSFILEQLAVIEARFGEESKVEVEKPDTDKFNSTILTLTNEATAAISRCAELEIEYAELKKKNDELSDLYLKKKQLLDNIEKADESISGLNNQLRKLQITTSTKVDDEEIERLKSQIKAAENHSALKNEHVKFMSLVSLKRFDGDESAFDKALQRVAGEKDMCRDQIHAMNTKITNLQNARINHDTCDKCGQGISHLEHVKEKNAQIDEQLELLTKELLKVEAEFNYAVAKESELQGVRRGALSVKGAYNLDSINYDNSFYPPKVTWVGGDIPDAAPVAPKAELTKLLETKKAVDTALAQVDLVKQQINDMQNRKHDFVVSAEKLNAPAETEIIKINADLQSLVNEYKALSGVKESSELEIERLNSEFALKQQVFSSHDEKLAALRGDIAQCKKNIETINFNNALIRKLRTIRPIIADKIWNTVLGSVSVMFSQIRGTPSVISKDKDGFKCNNQSVDALSGSTLDAFGLALRCALIRTFIPECGILVLDEPAHGMDSNRTAAMLGFIQSIDMGQTILITHEDVSSSIASNIIEL